MRASRAGSSEGWLTRSMRARRHDQRGASLLMAIVIMAVMTLILGAAVGFVTANQRSVSAYRDVRTDRYAGDAAIKAAINWAKDNPGVAVDDTYFPGANDACNYQVPAGSATLTVSCETPTGEGAGIPENQGLTPPEAMVLTGARHTEPGPYSWSKCASLWDNISNFFTGDTPGSSEKSLNIRLAQRTQAYGIASCKDRARPAPAGGSKTLTIQGVAAAAGQINVSGGMAVKTVNSAGAAVSGLLQARRGCIPGSPNGSAYSPSNACGGSGTARAAVDCDTPSTGSSCASGTARDTDPGIDTSTGGPLGIREAYLPVGFDNTGKLRSGYTLPVRTTAYKYDAAWATTYTNVPAKLKPIAACTDAAAGETIIFLPGWYQDSEVLSRYTSNSACPDRTFWFTPNPGADNTMLTDDDETGSFYLDFVGATGRACGDIQTAIASRWCLGGSAASAGQNTSNSKPRVVVGWPSGWTPLQTIIGGGTGTQGEQGSRVKVTIPNASTVDGGFLTYWSQLDNAKVADGAVAKYEPCSITFFGLTLYCPSFGQRTLRIKDFTPKVTGGPLGETGYSNGRIYVNVKWGIAGGANMNNPTIVVDALDGDGVEKTCGEFVLPKNGAGHDYNPASPSMPDTIASPARNYISTMSSTDAATLANNCGAVANINNYRVTLKWTGSPFNSDNPRFYLDGATVTYDSYQGASFPVGTDGAANSTQPAKSDCDEKKPGGQLILGGDSHVYAADGSLEVCGGRYPGGPGAAATHQVIGIYGVPAVQTIRPSSVAIDGASGGSGSTVLVNGGSANYIGEPAGVASATIKYPGKCYGFIGIGPCDPVDGGAKDVLATMNGYSPPTGYRIKRIAARAAYSAEGPFLGFTAGSDGAKIKAGGCSEDARTTNSELRQWANEGLGSSNPLVMYEINSAGTVVRNCLTPANLAAGAQVRWKTNVPGGWGVVFGGRCFVIIGSCNYTQEDQLEGMELDVTIEPDPSVAVGSRPVLKPASGCIVAHPNYEAGEGTPDCATVRADSYNKDDGRESICLISCGSALRGQWNGRVSVKGTLYAPSGAVEVDDTDVAYPLATRGLVVRQLTISGWGTRAGFTDPAISNNVTKTPAPRTAVFTACTQSAARQTAKDACDASAGDRLLTQAQVQFVVGSDLNRANVPVVQWYSDKRLGG